MKEYVQVSRMWLCAALLALFAGCGPMPEDADTQVEPEVTETIDEVGSGLSTIQKYCRVDDYHRVYISLFGNWNSTRTRFTMDGYKATYYRTGGFVQGNRNNEYLRGTNSYFNSEDWCPVGTTCTRYYRASFLTCSGCSNSTKITAYFDKPNETDPSCSIVFDFRTL
jgi:hypothetical protein